MSFAAPPRLSAALAADRPLARLLAPKSILIVGATSNFQRIGGIPIAALLAHNFPKDRLLLVNPKYKEIAGIPCLPSVENLPFVPDLAVLAIRAEEVVATLRLLHVQGVTAAVVFAAGFAEENTDHARALNADLVAFLDESGMKIAGPNTIGTANIADRTNAAFIPTFGENLPVGPLALIGQSGNTVSMMLYTAKLSGLGTCYFVSTGNETAVEFAEYLEHFLHDPQTGAVLGYIEQLRDGPRFVKVAAALRAAGKPLFLMKAGSSEKAAEATASHTGAMAGNVAVYAAAFRQLGVGIGQDPAEILEYGRLWSQKRRVRSRNLCIVSISGAGCAFLSDMFVARGVEIPTLDDATQAALRKVIPAYGMVTNPVDLTGNVVNEVSHMQAVTEALIASDAVDTIVFYIMGSLLDRAADILKAAAAKTDKLLIAIDTIQAERAQELQDAGVVVYQDIVRGVSAISGFLDWSARMQLPAWQPDASPRGLPAAIAEQIAAVRNTGRRDLDEVQAKRLLAAAGIATVGERHVQSGQEAATAAAELGFPVAIKVLSADIAHKSDVGGVILNVAGGEAARAAFDTVRSRAGKANPDALIEGAVVQRQITDGVGMIIGLTRDPTFGPVMTVGLGGVLTELYRDISQRLLPIDHRIAREMIGELKCAPLLHGYRGAALADVDALADAMVRLSEFGLALGNAWLEMEVNPIIVRPQGHGAIVVDALLRLSSHKQHK